MVGVAFHAFAEQPWRLEGLPDALRERARAYIDAVDAAHGGPSGGTRRCTAGHLVEVVLPAGRGRDRRRARSRRCPSPAPPAQLRERAEALAADGVDELAVQPGGDVPDGLRRLAAALI